MIDTEYYVLVIGDGRLEAWYPEVRTKAGALREARAWARLSGGTYRVFVGYCDPDATQPTFELVVSAPCCGRASG